MGLVEEALEKKGVKEGRKYRLLKGIMYYATPPRRMTPEPFSFLVAYVYTDSPYKWGDYWFDLELKKMVKLIHLFPENILIPVLEGRTSYAIVGVEVEEVDEDEVKEVTRWDYDEGEFKFEGEQAEQDRVYRYMLFYTHGGEKRYEYDDEEVKKRVKGITLSPFERRQPLKAFMNMVYRGKRSLTLRERRTLERIARLKRFLE